MSNKESAKSQFVSGQLMAQALTVLFGINMLLKGYELVNWIIWVGTKGGQQALLEIRIQLIQRIELCAYLVSATLFFIWLYRVYKNLRSLGANNLRTSPGGAVGYWFFPFINFVIPYYIFQEIWQFSRWDRKILKGDLRPSSLIKWWWGLFIAQAITESIASFTFGAGGLSDRGFNAAIMIVAKISSILAAIFFIAVIRKIDREQKIRSSQYISGTEIADTSELASRKMGKGDNLAPGGDASAHKYIKVLKSLGYEVNQSGSSWAIKHQESKSAISYAYSVEDLRWHAKSAASKHGIEFDE
jgi:hypothetical protein